MIRVGVNLDGVHVIDDDGNFIRLSLGYDEFTYNSYESQDDEDCFLIEYDAADGSGKAQMVIWSPQVRKNISRVLCAEPKMRPQSQALVLLLAHCNCACGYYFMAFSLFALLSQANMIDTLVTRHIEELGRWQEHIKSRKSMRQSYKPVKAAVRGRKLQESGKNETKYFTLSKASGGGGAAAASGGGSAHAADDE
jgi:hypothetical protein